MLEVEEKIPVPRPLMHLDILGHHGRGVLDTGAKQSVAGYQLSQILQPENRTFDTRIANVKVADGSQGRRNLLTTVIDVYLENIVVPTTLVVLPEAQNTTTLLGVDYMKRAGIVLNVPDEKWLFVDELESRDLEFEPEGVRANTMDINAFGLRLTQSIASIQGITHRYRNRRTNILHGRKNYCASN